MTETQQQLVVVTGMSGAGRTTALDALEDMDFQVIENVPLDLLPDLVHHDSLKARPIAIGLDSRNPEFTADAFLVCIADLRKDKNLDTRILFLDCAEPELQKRYNTSRRKHPMASDRPVADGIQKERAFLEPVRDAADLVFDTSDLTVHDLRRTIEGHFGREDAENLSIFIQSFGFKYGIPRESDMIFDVRFLPNPHWDEELRPYSGLEKPIQNMLQAEPDFTLFFETLTSMIYPLLPKYRQEGKRYLTISIGCTGGRHRSVFVASRLHDWLNGQGIAASLIHRDLERSSRATESVPLKTATI